MNDLQRMVTEFHRATGNPVAERPGDITDERKRLRVSLIREEFEELREAMGKLTVATSGRYGRDYGEADLVAVADALADLQYVVVGTAVEFGIDLAPITEEVHAANMRKTGGPVRADGKTLKPEGWQPPDVARLVAEQMNGD